MISLGENNNLYPVGFKNEALLQSVVKRDNRIDAGEPTRIKFQVDDQENLVLLESKVGANDSCPSKIVINLGKSQPERQILDCNEKEISPTQFISYSEEVLRLLKVIDSIRPGEIAQANLAPRVLGEREAFMLFRNVKEGSDDWKNLSKNLGVPAVGAIIGLPAFIGNLLILESEESAKQLRASLGGIGGGLVFAAATYMIWYFFDAESAKRNFYYIMAGSFAIGGAAACFGIYAVQKNSSPEPIPYSYDYPEDDRSNIGETEGFLTVENGMATFRF